jgi:hypothetical protein
LTGKKLDGEGSVSSLIVKTDTYHDQVKEGWILMILEGDQGHYIK